jgi:hypothetical protein
VLSIHVKNVGIWICFRFTLSHNSLAKKIISKCELVIWATWHFHWKSEMKWLMLATSEIPAKIFCHPHKYIYLLIHTKNDLVKKKDILSVLFLLLTSIKLGGLWACVFISNRVNNRTMHAKLLLNKKLIIINYIAIDNCNINYFVLVVWW